VWYVQISENGTTMTLYSAAEDFAVRTLSCVPGTLGKLRYVGALRKPDGTYEHWGLERTFGEKPARDAIESSHRELMLKLLRMPLREVMEDAVLSASAEDMKVSEYVEQLRREANLLVPADAGGGSVPHFSSILQALGSLAPSYMVANRQAS
jgi:hypothetical protein